MDFLQWDLFLLVTFRAVRHSMVANLDRLGWLKVASLVPAEPSLPWVWTAVLLEKRSKLSVQAGLVLCSKSVV